MEKQELKINSQHLQTVLVAAIDCLVICYQFSRPLDDRIKAIVVIVRDEFSNWY